MGLARLLLPALAHATRYDNLGGVGLAMIVFSPIWILSLLLLALVVYSMRKKGEPVKSTVLFWLAGTFLLWAGVGVLIAFQ